MKEILTDSRVYMFHNVIHDIYLFTNATHYADAMESFDLCNFKNRKEWRIFLECGSQPNQEEYEKYSMERSNMEI